jgi:hypothetical protein
MSESEIKNYLLEIYNFLHTSILDKSIHKINLAQNGQGKILDNFCSKIYKKFGDSIGVDWIVDYCIFQIHYWQDKTTNYKVTLGWVMGDKALDRYLQRPDGKMYYEDKMLKRKLGLTREELRKKWRKAEGKHPLSKYKETPHEDLIKAKFLNTELGYYQCQNSTTLYSNSKVCEICTYTEQCKKSLKIMYPELARIRGIH